MADPEKRVVYLEFALAIVLIQKGCFRPVRDDRQIILNPTLTMAEAFEQAELEMRAGGKDVNNVEWRAFLDANAEAAYFAEHGSKQEVANA